jgi:nucleotide-binding universal stress UspA family protein
MATIERLPREVLVATDFSDSADAALAVAIDYARLLHARLHLFHVYSPGEVEVTRLLADAAAAAAPGVPVTVAGAAGDPAEQILTYAGRHPIHLIVVGTHGRTGVSGLLLGSVAERVVRGARCPVLVVPCPRQPAIVAQSDTNAEGAEAARIRGGALEHKQRGTTEET